MFKRSEFPVIQLQKIGLSLEELNKTGNLEKLLKGEKSDLITITVESIKRDVLLYLERYGKTVILKIIHTYHRATQKQINALPLPVGDLEKNNLTLDTLRENGNLERILRGEKSLPIEVDVFIMGKYLKKKVEIFLTIQNNCLKFYFDVLLE